MHYGWPPLPLLVRHHRSPAGLVPTHMLPEFFEIVGDGHAVQTVPDVLRQCVVRRVHVRELGAAQGPAVATGNADTVQSVHESYRFTIGHIGLPVLAGIRTPDILAVLLDVGKD